MVVRAGLAALLAVPHPDTVQALAPGGNLLPSVPVALMPTGRLGLVALVLGAATWAQLVLVPLVARAPDGPSAVAGALALGALIAATALRARAPRAAVLALGVYPLALGVFAFVLGRRPVPRFDAAARVVAALTALGFAAATAAWARAAAPVYAVSLAPLADRGALHRGHGPAAPAPPLRYVSQGVLAGAALFCSVVAPSLLAAREARTVDEDILRGRHALVSAAGLLIAVALVLGGGSAVARAAPPRPRRPARAMGYLAWGALAYLMRTVLDSQR